MGRLKSYGLVRSMVSNKVETVPVILVDNSQTSYHRQTVQVSADESADEAKKICFRFVVIVGLCICIIGVVVAVICTINEGIL